MSAEQQFNAINTTDHNTGTIEILGQTNPCFGNIGQPSPLTQITSTEAMGSVSNDDAS